MSVPVSQVAGCERESQHEMTLLLLLLVLVLGKEEAIMIMMVDLEVPQQIPWDVQKVE